MYLPQSKIYMGKATQSRKGAQAADMCLSAWTSSAFEQAQEQLSLQQTAACSRAHSGAHCLPALREPGPGSALSPRAICLLLVLPASLTDGFCAVEQKQQNCCLSSICCQAGWSAVETPSGSLNLAKLHQTSVCDPQTQIPSQSCAGSTAGPGEVLWAVTCFVKGSLREFSRLVSVFFVKFGWGEQDCFFAVMETGPCYAVYIIGCHTGASGDVDCAHLHKSKNKYTHKPLQSKYATDN